MFTYCYGGYIRKMVVAFGTLFNNLYVEHPEDSTEKLYRVPITYAPKEKFVRRLLEESSISNDTKIGIRLPQLSFALGQIAVDPNRRRTKVNYDVVGQSGNKGKEMMVEVPLNLSFDLYMYTRHISDTLQIAEQIIPHFNPELIMNVNFGDGRTDTKVPLVMMNSINLNSKYDGDFGNRRINMSSIGFVAKAYMFHATCDTDQVTLVQDFNLDVETSGG